MRKNINEYDAVELHLGLITEVIGEEENLPNFYGPFKDCHYVTGGRRRVWLTAGQQLCMHTIIRVTLLSEQFDRINSRLIALYLQIPHNTLRRWMHSAKDDRMYQPKKTDFHTGFMVNLDGILNLKRLVPNNGDEILKYRLQQLKRNIF